MYRFICFFVVLTGLVRGLAMAGEANVVDVTVRVQGDKTYRFDVTVQHADTGWDHFANAWEILSPDGTILATRVLYHPHVNEQPFTRSLSGVEIPASIQTVTIQAKDSIHEYGGLTVDVPLTQ